MRNTGQGDEGEHPKVREQLRGLRKIRAPWYFESTLYRRLQEQRPEKRRGRWAGPRMAYAAIPALIILIGGAAYFYFAAKSGGENEPGRLSESALLEPPPPRTGAGTETRSAPKEAVNPRAVRAAEAARPSAVPRHDPEPRTRQGTPAGAGVSMQARRDSAVRPNPPNPELRVSAPATILKPAASLKDSARKPRRDSVRVDSLAK